MSPLFPESPGELVHGAEMVRLIEGQGPIAVHLQNYAEASSDVQRPSFARLMEARAQRRRRHAYLAWGGAAGVALAAAALLSIGAPERPHMAPDTKFSQVERSLVHETPAAPEANASGNPAPTTSTAGTSPSRGRPSTDRAPTAPLVPVRTAPPIRLADCEAKAAAASYDAARSCFAQIALGGSTTDAELAWLEKARLEARALGRPDLALETFAGYRARFPRGKLALEARIAEAKSRSALERKAPVEPETAPGRTEPPTP